MKSSAPKGASTWEELVSRMRVGRSGTAEAVHKPLFTLILLARAQQGESNQMAFREVDPLLRRAMEQFGPAHRSYSTEYPFWHLQNEGFWVVDNPDDLPRRKGKDRPTRTGLLEHDARGHVPAELWAELTSDPQLLWRLVEVILTRHWSKSIHQAILAYFGLRRPQPSAVALDKPKSWPGHLTRKG